MLENFKNLYEVRKNASFSLETIILNRKITINNAEKSVEEILKQYEIIVTDLRNLLYYENIKIEKKETGTKLGDIFDFSKLWFQLNEDNEKFSLKNKKNSDLIRIKHGWLQKFFTNDWYENKEKIISKRFDKNKKIEIKTKNWTTIWSAKFLKDFFEDFFRDANENYKKLSELAEVQEYEQKRQSDIKLALQAMQSKDHLYKIYQLFAWKYIEHKNNNAQIEWLAKKLSSFKENVDFYIENCKINESFGVPVEHMSLNYYTRRKSQKEYSKEINDKSESLQNKYYWDLWELYGIDKNSWIEKLYNEIKIFKANQKSAFLELLQKGVSYDILKDKFDYIDNQWNLHKDYQLVLFDDINEVKYNEMKSLTSLIEKEQDKEKKKELKNKRWKYFLFHCKNYKNFCEKYKKVAMEYGKRKAEVLSLEREKILAERERWYAFFSRDSENNFYINTFGIENSKEVYHYIKNNTSKNWDISYFVLSSITLRALEKLCFSQSSNFNKWEIIKKIDKKFIKIQQWSWREIFKSREELENEEILIEFIIEIIEKQNTLWLKFKSEQSKNFLKYAKNLDDFEILLKQETYILDEYLIEKTEFEKILQKFQWNSYKLTSRDLQKNEENTSFAIWWNNFWKTENKNSDYILRINPEFVISFRKWDPEKFPKNHRKWKDSFLIRFSFSHFSDKKYIDAAFVEDDERKENLQKFNELYNKNNNLEYFYGIDKWTKELVTLWIFKKLENWLQKVNISEKIPVYRITEKGFQHFEEIKNEKSGEMKKRFLAKNVSYFLKELSNPELFEKLEISSCLWDLTYAKLIKWNIILNADIFTTVSLYTATAKRFIYDAFYKWWIKNNAILFNESEKYFYFEYENRGNTEEKIILYWKEEFDYLPCKEGYTSFNEGIKSELENYIKDIKDDKAISIQGINNYKNAISANIVWIIAELQKYFNGYICYEALDKWQIDAKWFNTFIGNVVNEKIYNKFQLSKEVPPILKKFRTDVGEKWILQHGKVIYIHEKNTSSACPVCNEKLLKYNKNGDIVDKDDLEVFKLYGHLTKYENSMQHINNENDKDFQKWKWKSSNLENWNLCDYHIWNEKYSEFDFIKSWDDLAAYNIAKKVKEYLENIEE